MSLDRLRHLARLGLLTIFNGALILCAAEPANADEKDRLYDFTDAYYRSNGVNPTGISNRRQPVPPLATSDVPFFSYQNHTRALLTISSYSDSGNIEYFTVMGELSVQSFTNDAAGKNARAIADQFPEYIFPKHGNDPLGLGNTRQSGILDLRNGYFGKNPLGLWIHTFVSYTDKAFSTADGQKTLAKLAQQNGVDLDGTPLIRSVSDIDNLYKKGYISKQYRALNDPQRYAICPVIKDPTKGGIAPDQFLVYPEHPDGTPLEPLFLENFLSLQQTGHWAH